MKSSLNSIFRTIWSEALGAWVAVSEITKTKGKRTSSSLIRSIRPVGSELDSASDIGGRLKPIVFAVACCFALGAQANPLGGQVVNGQATFNTTGNTLTVTNTPGTIINWQGFSINSNEVTHFAQQSAASSVLNRVVTNNPSAILGTLSSNGRVFLVNPSGIFFGAGSTVDVAGLVATSLNLSNADFLAGRHNFTAVAGAQNISNAGNINAQQNGQVYLIAPNVENTGIINAPNGEILLVAGHSVELVNDLDPNLRVNITAPAGDATNVGQLVASAGRLGLFGTVVKNAGTVSADSATMQGGKIVFRSSQRTEVSGTASAKGVGGGEIKVLSDMQTGTVSVSGTLDASAPVSGDGGFIDTSAAHLDLKPTASIKASAANGKAGEWLIDPLNVTIGTGVDTGGTFTGGIWMPITSGSFITSGTIEAALNLGTNVTITTANGGIAEAGDITVTSNITMTGAAPATLTLQADNDIIFNAGAVISSTNVTPTALNVVLNADSDGVNGGAIVMNSGSSIISNGGNITLGGGVAGNGSGFASGNAVWANGITLTSAILNAGGGNIVLNGQGDLFGSSNMGVQLLGSSLITSGLGSISVTGTGGGVGTGTLNRGVRIENLLTAVSSLTSVDGAISITAQGASRSDGFQLIGGSTIQSGNGAITVNAISGTEDAASTTSVYGAWISGAGTLVSSTGGNIQIAATSQGNVGTSNRGLSIDTGAQVITTGLTNSITLSGTGGVGSNFNYGVIVTDAGTLVQSAGGNISIIGQGQGSGTDNYGILIRTTADVIAAGAGTINFNGTGGNGTDHNTGIVIADVGTTVSAVNGGITFNGTSGAGTGTYNRGINIQGGTVSTSGTGAINLTGQSAATATSSYGRGMEIREGGIVQTNTGALNITGSSTVGSSALGTSFNEGIYIIDVSNPSGLGAGKVLSTSGAITLNGTAWGTGTDNSGINLLHGATVDVTGGASSISLVSANNILLGGALLSGTAGNTLSISGWKTWDGGAATTNWADALNWSDNLAPSLIDKVYLHNVSVNAAGTLSLAEFSAGNATLNALAGLELASSNNIALSSSIISGASNAVVLKAGNNILLSSAGAVTSTLDITLNSDSDGINGGAIEMRDASYISSFGSNVRLGGGLAGNASGNAMGNTVYSNGIEMLSGSYIDARNLGTGTGSVTLIGQGYNLDTSNMGVHISASNVFADLGTVSVNGTGGGGGNLTGTSNRGVRFGSGSLVSTVSGAINITGNAGWDGDGVQVMGASTITSVTGSISIVGAVTTGDGSDYGVYITASDVVAGNTTISTGGNITISGDSSAIASGLNNRGLSIGTRAQIQTTSAGNINLTGLAGRDGDGINLGGIIESVSGAINLTGTSGAGPSFERGIVIEGVAAHILSTTGNISLTGTSTAVASSSNHGVYISDTDITGVKTGGNILIVGSAAAGATSYGVNLWDFVDAGGTATIESNGNILIQKALVPLGNMIVRADNAGTGIGTVTFTGLGAITSAVGKTVNLYYNPVSYSDAATKSDTLGNPYSANLLGAGTNTAWMLVNDVGLETGGTLGLQAMATNLAGNYALGKDFAAATSLWNAGAGFAPVGTISTSFTGMFDGQGHIINGLFINTAGNGGLFGYTNGSTIKNVTLTNVNITASGYAGGLVGRHQGTLSNSHVLTGTVTGTSFVGGLIGINYNGSNVSNSSAGATVSGSSYVGGLIGASQTSNLSNVSATGNVTGTNWAAGGLVGSMDGDSDQFGTPNPHSLINGTASGNVNGSRYVGGLVGWNGFRSSITSSSASGNVVSTDTNTDTYSASGAGGLVGMNAYTITNSHATGNVTGVANVGGLVGNNYLDNNPWFYYTYGSVSNSYATTGTVTGITSVGGLVGINHGTNASISGSNAGGAVSGLNSVGGLVGYNYRGAITTTFATGAVTPSTVNSVSMGGLVGDNSGTITDSYVTTASVLGYMNVGGLVGANHPATGCCYPNNITNSYVSGGSVTGLMNSGGLVGYNAGTLTNSHYNINNVLINGANIVTVGGLYNDSIANAQGIGQYSDWLIGKSLNIADYTIGSGGSSFGNGGTGIYTISNVNNAAALQGLKDMLGFTDNYLNTFTLTGNVDLASLPGFYVPMMASSFNGAGFTISNLNVNLDTSYLGFFGTIDSLSTVSNVSLLNATVRSNGPIKGDNIGALAGMNKGTINSSSVSNTNVDGGTNVGGLVGLNSGTINSSSVSTGTNGSTTILGNNSVGGLVGSNSGAINTSSFSANSGGTASVTGTTNVGGLVGTHSGLVLNQSGVSVIPTGVVNVTGVSNVGGLVGTLTGNIDQDYVTGVAITATGTNVGGVAGVGLVNSIYCNLGCFYNVNTVTINGLNYVTPGALYNTQYNAWYNAGNYTPLAIGNYASLALQQLDGSYGISSVQGMQDMLGFAHLAIYNFILTGSVDLAILPRFYVPKLAGSFNGNNFNISNLNINLPNSDIGLFGNINFTSSVVSNLNLVNASVSGSGNVGALVGLNNGTIDNVSVTGTTSVSSVSTGMNIGGLVGKNFRGNISNSDVTGATVSGISEVGGLVGFNSGMWTYSGGSTGGIISNSFVSNGSVTGTAGSIGGLVGDNWDGAITGSHVTNPTVNGGVSSRVGGLVGYNRGGSNLVYQGPSIPSIAVYYGYISNSYVSGGTVTSTGNDVGGLLGRGYGGLVGSSWTDTVGVTGNLNVGGLVGYDGGEGANPRVGVVSNSHALNPLVTGHSHVGGLVGYLGISLGSSNVRDNNFVVSNSYVSGGTVSSNATTLSATGIGGLVGYNFESNISGSYVTNGTVVNGGFADRVGGLVGHNNGFSTTHGRIVGSYVNGVVVGTTASTGSVTHIGGLVGFNSGTISNSYVSGGTVGAGTSGALLYNVGGLVGSNNLGYINNSYVTGGTVSGYSAIGGLAGFNNGAIFQSYAASGTVSGFSIAGGLVGYNNFSGNVDNSFWDINTTGLGVGNGFGTDFGYLNTLNVVGLTSVQSKTQADVEAVFGVGTVANTGGAGLTWRIYEGQTTPLLSSFLKPLVITAAAASKTYDGAVYSGGLVNPTYTDGVNPVVPNSPDILGTANAYGLNAINAGTYAPALYSGQQGYDISYVGGMLTIGTSSVSIINLNGTRVYDGTVNVDWSIFTLAGLIGSETLTLSGVGTVADANVGINKPVSLGTLALGNGTNGGLASNYTLTGGSHAATITPATLTYTANPASRTYGANNPAFSGSVTGFVLGETLATATTGTPVFTTLATNTSNVGSYALTGEGLLANNGNYTFVQAASNATALSVTPATLTYTANAANRIYGDTDPAFSGMVTGFVLSDNLANATTGTAVFTTSASFNSNVGSYAINGSGLTANNGNYMFVQAAGNATAYSITQRIVSVIASATSKVYGDADPNSFTVGGGLAAWDTNSTAFSGSLSHTGGENVVGSPYAITLGTLTANANYTVSGFTSDWLTITPATLTVIADSKNKVLGTPDPLLTYMTYGLKFNDTAATTLSGELTRDAGDTVGTYSINGDGLILLSSNYYPITYVAGTFRILAPTVVQEITQMTMQSAPTEKTATTSQEEEKKESAELLAEAAIVDDSGQPLADPLPVCR